MSVRDLPRSRSGNRRAVASSETGQHPFMALRREVNRLVDNAFRGFGGWPASLGKWPSVDVVDEDKDIRVMAEVPGLDSKDIEVLLDNGVLTLRGEKLSETKDKDRQVSERFYGRFERRIPLASEVDESKVKADFKNGILTVTLPKTRRAQAKTKRIPVNGKH